MRGRKRRRDATRRAYRGDMSAENVPEAVKQFVTCLYGHVRDKNGAFDGRRECDLGDAAWAL